MARVIALGGLGLFGRTVVAQLARFGIRAITASRSSGVDLRVDANDAASIRSVVRPGDLVVDAAGPFQLRNDALVQAAMEVGFDVIDLNDNFGYCERILKLEPAVNRSGIRMLTSASSVSAVAACVVRNSGVVAPVRLTAFLAPATRHTANAGTALSLLGSVGRPITIYRAGRLQSLPGWSESRRFTLPLPVGPICGSLFESADVLNLPRIWPTLRDVAMYVDTNVLGGNALFRLAARWPSVRRVMEKQIPIGTWLTRQIGSSSGGIGYEIEDAHGRIVRRVITSPSNSYIVAVAPAVLAARAIVDGRFAHQGLVPADRHVEPAELFEYLRSVDIHLSEVE